MPNNTANITATTPRQEGEFFRALLGTEVPVDAKTALGEPFKLQGYTDEDGFTVTQERETTDKKSYGGVTVYTTQDSYGVSLQVTVLETMNLETKRTVFGDDNVTEDEVTGIIKTRYNSKRLPNSVFVADHLTDQGFKRQIIENGLVTSVGDIQFVHNEMVKYQLTVTAYPNADGDYMIELDEPLLAPIP